jgi:Na+/alanine symporter
VVEHTGVYKYSGATYGHHFAAARKGFFLCKGCQQQLQSFLHSLRGSAAHPQALSTDLLTHLTLLVCLHPEQAVAKWLEQLLPFLFILGAIFVYHYLSGG